MNANSYQKVHWEKKLYLNNNGAVRTDYDRLTALLGRASSEAKYLKLPTLKCPPEAHRQISK